MLDKEKIKKSIDDRAREESLFCYCSGPICSGCDKKVQKLFSMGAEWMLSEMDYKLRLASEALIWADEMLTARDEMNSKIHCSPVRLSEITLRVKAARKEIEGE